MPEYEGSQEKLSRRDRLTQEIEGMRRELERLREEEENNSNPTDTKKPHSETVEDRIEELVDVLSRAEIELQKLDE